MSLGARDLELIDWGVIGLELIDWGAAGLRFTDLRDLLKINWQ
jgi:hypothetical protein